MRNLINQAVFGDNTDKDVFEELTDLDSDRQIVLNELKKRERQTSIYVGNKVNIRWNKKAERIYQSLFEESKAFWETLKQTDRDVHLQISSLEKYIDCSNKEETIFDLFHRRDFNKCNVSKLTREIVVLIDDLNMLDGIVRHFHKVFKESGNIEDKVAIRIIAETQTLLSRLLQAVFFIKHYKEPLRCRG